MCLTCSVASHDDFEVAQACNRQGSVIAVAGVGTAHSSLDAIDGIAAQAEDMRTME